ncbi:MAG: hypothetical protein PGN13_01405 [Patulibacter minatonensis]
MSSLARPTVHRLPLAATAAGFVALACALLAGPGGTGIPSAVFGAAAGLLVVAEVTRRARQLLRAGLAPQIGLAVLGSAVVSAAWQLVVALHQEYYGLAAALGLGGTALLVRGLLRLAAVADADQTPWQALTGGPTAARTARNRFSLVAPLLTGVLAMILALRVMTLALDGHVSDQRLAVLFTLALLVIYIAGPAWALLRSANARANRPAAVPRDEQVVAAHLHDSVLQTLSLIRRNAADPVRVAQLSRQQERSLRAWLAGRDEPGADSLAGAVRLVAQEVEDEEPGTVIEVVTVGDAPLDRPADAMVQAAREAMRNAARHGRGPVRVFVEVEPGGGRQLFVRDAGDGFDLARVADERRGVRDAIIGRMAHVGGTAEIDSGAAGTEIALTLPLTPEAGSADEGASPDRPSTP